MIVRLRIEASGDKRTDVEIELADAIATFRDILGGKWTTDVPFDPQIQTTKTGYYGIMTIRRIDGSANA